jgi:hypothetical protein
VRDPAEDAQELALSLADPDRYRHQLLLPRSGWELYRWNREDAWGFAFAVLTVVGILLLMQAVVSLGR